MLQDTSTIVKEFSVWNSPTEKPRIQIYIQIEDSEQHFADFHIDWTYLGHVNAPQLHIFDDCWYVLFHYCQDLLVRLADLNANNATLEQIKHVLLELGYKDMTND